jgi:hypothetical protein
MHCAEFEALLTEAIDGLLGEAQLATFRTHAEGCPNCGPLLAEAESGRRWLSSLVEVEPPRHLVHNILAATTGLEERHPATQVPAAPGWGERLFGWARPLLAPVWASVRQPRFAMSFGMAFFSVSIALSVAGVKVSTIRHLDLRPSAIKRSYYETQARVVKYYENIRFVYEIESRVRALQRATTPAESGPREERREERKEKNNTSGKPEERQERNYSRDDSQPVLASAPDALPMAALNRSEA